MNLTDENFDKEINTKDGLVLVDFFATWCEPCSLLGPVLEKVSENFKGKIVLMKANVDSTPLAAQKFEVDRIPKVVLFKNGKEISSFIGLMPEKAIKEWLENMLKDENKHGK